MNRIFLLFAAFALLLPLQAQNKCTAPLSQTVFQQRLNRINSTNNAMERLNMANQMATSQCLSAFQVKSVVMLLANDEDKLKFSRLAYANTVDKINFYDVYDGFAYFSNVFRLHDFVEDYNNGTTLPPPPPANPPVTPSPPKTGIQWLDLPYPNPKEYLGSTSCPEPLPTRMFTEQVERLANNASESVTLNHISNMAKTQCLSTEQIMKLASLLQQQTNRLEFVKMAYARVFDRDNYMACKHLFTFNNIRNEFVSFLEQSNAPSEPVQPVCRVTEDDMRSMIQAIENASFDSVKLNTGKQVVAAKKCLTVDQIMRILEVYSFESSKLEMAKYCYAYCINQDDYYKVNNVFSFSSSKDELTKYIQSR